MLTIPNLLSILRVPLAFVFLHPDPIYRAVALALAMLSDGLDGFLARQYKMISKLGTLLDPIVDKFFVFFILSVFFAEGRITIMEACSMICRDFSVILFMIYLAASGKLASYRVRAIWCGKASTFLQFAVLLSLNFWVSIPNYLYAAFILLGIMALAELYIVRSPEVQHD